MANDLSLSISEKTDKKNLNVLIVSERLENVTVNKRQGYRFKCLTIVVI